MIWIKIWTVESEMCQELRHNLFLVGTSYLTTFRLYLQELLWNAGV